MTYRQGDDSTYQFQFSGVSFGGWDGPGMFDEVTLCGLGECMKASVEDTVRKGRERGLGLVSSLASYLRIGKRRITVEEKKKRTCR